MDRGKPSPEHGDEQLTRADVRRRATAGAAFLGGRAALILSVGVAANIVLARLLVPRDFGLVALGTVFVALGGSLAEGGLGAALIRRERPPSRRELEAVNGLQLVATGSLLAVVGMSCIVAGRDGLVITTMVASLPIAVLRAPAVIALERQLDFRVIAKVDVLEAVVFYAWAVGAVALGMGVWGIATATVVRALTGTVAMARLGPLGLSRPRWSWPDVSALVGFGVKMQAVALATLLRDQGLNATIALVAGLSTLGIWNLAYRVLQIPYSVFMTAGRVMYPTMARAMRGGSDAGRIIERAIGSLAVLNGMVLIGVAGLAPALPDLVGHAWEDVPATLLWSTVALVVGAPGFVVLSSYLYAADEVGTVLRAVIVHGLVWATLTLPLVAVVGAPIIGLGWIAAASAGNVVLWRRASARAGVRWLTTLLIPIAAGLAGIASAWAVGVLTGAPAVGCVAAVAAGETVFLAGIALLRPSTLVETYALASQAMRGAATGGRVSPTGEV